MRGLIYSLNLHGVGHIKRMLFLAEGLLKEGGLTFIQGGQDVGITIHHPSFKHTVLGAEKSSENWEERQRQIREVLEPVDFVIIEQIPFSKLNWLGEVVGIIERVKEQNPHAVIICSHKGAMKEQSDNSHEQEKVIIDVIKKYFDAILVHSDPKLILLDDSFGSVAEIADRVHYTGFISRNGRKYGEVNKREKVVVVTNGAGDKGLKLIRATVSVMEQFPDYTFKCIAGPMMSTEIKSQLYEVATNTPNMEVIDFVDDFEELLLQSSLLVTLAGFTLVSAYATQVPTITFPAPTSSNQHVVARKFGLIENIHVVREEDLNPPAFQATIQELLKNPPQSGVLLDIDGVKKSVEIIKNLISQKQKL